MGVRIGAMDKAGPYYGKTFEELESIGFNWTPEEERLIERFCAKINENCHEEEMTPFERWKATFAAKDRDRLQIDVSFNPAYAMRVLDGFSFSFHAIEAYQYPKLFILSTLAMTAAFKLENIFMLNLSYGENVYGWNASLIENGSPVHIGEAPIKTVEDLEGLEAADPTKHSIYPQYLWSLREVRRIMDKHGLSGVIPLQGIHCESPDGAVGNHMIGYPKYMKLITKDPEFVKKCMEFTVEFQTRYGIAVANVGKADYSFQCGSMGKVPPTDWIAVNYGRVPQAIRKAIPKEHKFICAWALDQAVDWLPLALEKGVFGDGFAFDGVKVTGNILRFKEIYEFAQANNLFGSASPSDKLHVEGPNSAVEEAIAARAQAAKIKGTASKSAISLGMIDYFTTPEAVNFAMETCKKLGRF